MKIAVFLPNWIGDAVMATPALRAVRQQFADAEIVGVLRPYVAEVLSGLDLVDRMICDASRGHNHILEAEAGSQGNRTLSLRGWELIRCLRRERFDLAVLFPNSFRSAWLAWLSGAKRRVGMSRDARSWLLTDRIAPKPKHVPHPVIDEYLRIAEHLGCADLTRKMELAVTPEDEQLWSRFLARHPEWGKEGGYVCLNPGGAFGAAKHWPTASFGILARRLAVELQQLVLVLCGPAERMEARQIVKHADHPRVVSLAGFPTGLGLTKAAVKHSVLLVTTDSGPRHFAPPFGVPVVTLFGPTHRAWSETYFEKAVHLQLDVDCGPCQQRLCPLGHHRCMTDLTVDQVFDASVNLLDQYSHQAAAA